MWKIGIKIDTRFILANIKSTDQFFIDATKKNFLAAVKAYDQPTKEDQNSDTVLGAIRGNAIFNAQLYLKSEESPSYLSLKKLSEQKEDELQKRDLNPKDIEKVIRLCKSSKAEVDLIRNENNLPISYSCFLCEFGDCYVNM